MPSTHPKDPGPKPDRPGGLPGWPRQVARAPRVRDLAILLGVGLPPLLDPVGSNKGAGPLGRVWGLPLAALQPIRVLLGL